MSDNPTFVKVSDSFALLGRFFFNRYPLHNSVPISCTPFFIIGSGRSGTTLLRAILSNHPDVAIPPESYVLYPLIRTYCSLNYLKWKELCKLVVGEFESHPHSHHWEIDFSGVYAKLLALKNEERSLARILDEIYCYFSQQMFPTAKIWGDKTPLNTYHLSWIDRVFPNARYIHLIRDGRDVVSSFVETKLQNLENACVRWNESVGLALDFGKQRPNQYLEVRYENLTASPQQEIEKLCRFIGIQFIPEMIQHRSNVSRMGGDASLPHHVNLKNDINTSSIGKWRKSFTVEEQAYIEKTLNDNLRLLGYI